MQLKVVLYQLYNGLKHLYHNVQSLFPHVPLPQVTGVELASASRTPLYSAVGNTVTAECNNRWGEPPNVSQLCVLMS